MRIKVFQVLIYIVFIFPLVGLVYLQIIKGNYYFELSQKNYIRLIPQEASRGKILDRNRNIIVDNWPSFDLAVVPQELRDKDKDKVFSYLSSLLDVDKKELLGKYKKSYVAPFSPVILAENISKEKVIMCEEKKSSLPAIFLQVRPRRFYKYNDITAHVIGYLGLIDRSRITQLKDYGYKIKDTVGYSGIEEKYDQYLRGEDGGIQIEVDHRGRQKRVLGIRSPKSGKDLILTVDILIQEAAFDALDKQAGVIVVMNPYSGDILAMVSNPSFDPNIFEDGISDARMNWFLKDPSSPLLNRAIGGLYAPGSTFKIINVMAALDKNKISLARTFLCTGLAKIGRGEFKCWSVHGAQNLKDALVHSCNVFFYNLGLIVGANNLQKYALDFGLGRLTGIDLPYEAAGIVPNPSKGSISKSDRWYDGDTANFSIGQGELLVTPLQMANVMASIVNGGRLVTPHLLMAVDGQEVREFSSENSLKLSLKPGNLNLLKSFLRSVVSEPTGTANVLNFSNLTVAGKTGTAQTGTGKSHAWFVGFCPYEKPQMVFCVVLEYGGSGYNACVVAKRFLSRLLENNIFKNNLTDEQNN